MKKILAIILALAAAVCCLTVSVSAAEPFSVDLSVGTYTFGTKTLAVDVVINGSFEVNSISVTVKYPDFLSIASADDMTVLDVTDSNYTFFSMPNPWYGTNEAYFSLTFIQKQIAPGVNADP